MTLSAKAAVEAFTLQQTIDDHQDLFPGVQFDLSTDENVRDALNSVEEIFTEDETVTLGDYYQDYLHDSRYGAEVVHDDRFEGHGGRCYECATGILRLPGGAVVAFPFWYGGGKYGCPGEMEWLDEAIYVKPQEVTTIKWVDA